jgi:rhodanese-related sulfurtransferase
MFTSEMQRFLEFLAHHPYIAGGTVTAALAVAVYEVWSQMQAFAGVSATQAVQLMNQGALVLDLRARESYEAGHITDARSLPAAQLAAEAESLKKWREKTVITYCDTGSDGAGAARTLAKLGFVKVVNLQGGLNGWLKDNLPLVKSKGGK